MFKKGEVVYLDNCCFNKDNLLSLKEQITSVLEEDGYTDLSFMLPSILTDDDIESIINKYL